MQTHPAPLTRSSSATFLCRLRLLLASAVVLCCALFAAAQEKPASDRAASDSGNSTATSKSGKTPDVSKEALAWDKLQTRMRFEADGTDSRETTAVVRVLADAGVKQMAVLTFTYTSSNQEVDIGYVRVRKPDGAVVVTPDYNTQDLPADVTREAPMYSDIHQKHVAVKGLGVGDTLEYNVTIRTLKPEVPGQFWAEYTFEKDAIILNEELDLDLPADKGATVASADVQPAISTTNGRKLYRWTSSNLSRPDPNAPPKSTKHWKPSIQVTTFTSWEQIGAWYASLQQPSLAVTPAIQTRVATVTKGLTTDDGKIRAIFNDVALHIHYVGLEFGIGRYQPHPADDVLSNEYGDCKDKHTLLAAMLKAAGIQTWPVLISSSRELDAATPSPAQFDHVITVAPLAGKLVWMDSTAEIAPVGTLFATLRDKQALAIPVDKPAYLERTPADLPYPQTAKFDASGTLSGDGVFTGHLSHTYHGDVELIVRAAFRQVPQSQWTVFVQRISNFSGFAGEVKDPEVSPIEDTAQPLHFSYDYSREKYGDWDDHRITPPLPPVGNELAPGVVQKKPADDVELGSPGEADYSASIQLPKGWSAFPPQNTNLVEDWAEYHSSYSFKDGKFSAERRLITKKNKVPLDQWDKYLAFRRAIFEDEVRMTPIAGPGMPMVAGGLINGFDFASSAGLRLADDERTQMLQPLLDATQSLGGEKPPQPADLAKLRDSANKAVEAVETKTIQLPVEDIHSLYWTQLLTLAWETKGRIALETHDLPTAETYLQAAWHLGQNRQSCFELGRVFEAKENKIEAAHTYLLCKSANIANPLLGLVDSTKVDRDIAARYQALAGRDVNAPSVRLPGGAYVASPQAELDKVNEFRQITHTSKVTGSALFSLSFEPGKPAQVRFLGGDPSIKTFEPALKTFSYHPMFPTGSKARILREMQLVCTPYAGCDGYMKLPTSVQNPSIELKSTGSRTEKNGVIQIQLAPPPQ
ncbi:MAG TPA: DUF3857 and transglutaminase domain-containing protein [Terracidiphilus sp.]|jgi:hypothetical protein